MKLKPKLKPQTKASLWGAMGVLFVGLFGIGQTVVLSLSFQHFLPWMLGWALITAAVMVLTWLKVSSHVAQAAAQAATWERDVRNMIQAVKEADETND